MEYTAKDEVKTKFLGGTTGGFLQEINYEYLANGFLKGINPTMTGADLFQLNINYDQAVAELNVPAQLNGNIAQLSWNVQGGFEQTYGYTYDFKDQLIQSTFGTITNGILGVGNEYGTTYEYDERGNIIKLNRKGVYWNGTTWKKQTIDSLDYTPIAGTNQIKAIADKAGCPENKLVSQMVETNQTHAVEMTLEGNNVVDSATTVIFQAGQSVTLMSGFHAKAGTDFTAKIAGCPTSGFETDGFVQRSSADYAYDAEGNMIIDPNKGAIISYKYHNLPFKADFGGGKEIEWTYDGNGTKLQKIIRKGGNVVSLQDYLEGGIEYRNDTLEAINHAEGRAFFEGGMPQYEFRLADHLDNTRVLFSDKNGDGSISENEISDISSYYAFGLRHRGINAKINNTHDYLFNNKERVGDFGLRWDFYDFRVLDSEIGRFIQVDPIAEQFPHVSPMNYAENEPIAHIDLHGLQKHKPKGQSIDKPSDLLSIKMLNNLKEGAKTVVVEMGRVISDGLNVVVESVAGTLPAEGSPNASDFQDSGSEVGTGFEVMTGNNELKSAGTSDEATAKDGSTAIIDEVLTAGVGGTGSFTKDKLEQPLNAINRAGDIKKKLDEIDIKTSSSSTKGKIDTTSDIQYRTYRQIITTSPSKKEEND